MLLLSSCSEGLVSNENSPSSDYQSENLFTQTSPQSLFTIIRTNYKEDHILHYDVLVDSGSCEISSSNPIDGYYIRNGSRIDFNDKNKEYYQPNILPENKSKNHIEYNFPVLTGLDTLKPEHRRIVVDVKKTAGSCVTTAKLTYQDEQYRIHSITMKLKLIFGFPTGTEWARLDATNKSGQPGSVCLLGECE